MSHDHVPTPSVNIRSDTIFSDISVSSASSSDTSPLSPFISGSSTSSGITSATSSVASDNLIKGSIEKRLWLLESPSPTSPFTFDDIMEGTTGQCSAAESGGDECETPLADVSLSQTLSRINLPPAAIPLPSSPEDGLEAMISIERQETMKKELNGITECSNGETTTTTPANTPVNTPSCGEDDLRPPANFGIVADGVYRSSFPKKENFPFLNTLKLKTVLVLVQEEYPPENMAWVQSQNIKFLQFGIPGHKEAPMPPAIIEAALLAVLDKRNHPMLIHCNKGKHRTGCLVACLRRLQNWTPEDSIAEYCKYSSPKDRAADKAFVSAFELAKLRTRLHLPSHKECLPLWMADKVKSVIETMEGEKGTAEGMAVQVKQAVVDAPT